MTNKEIAEKVRVFRQSVEPINKQRARIMAYEMPKYMIVGGRCESFYELPGSTKMLLSHLDEMERLIYRSIFPGKEMIGRAGISPR